MVWLTLAERACPTVVLQHNSGVRIEEMVSSNSLATPTHSHHYKDHHLVLLSEVHAHAMIIVLLQLLLLLLQHVVPQQAESDQAASSSYPVRGDVTRWNRKTV